jgi:Ca2+-binding EF-hand superfamily protein
LALLTVNQFAELEGAFEFFCEPRSRTITAESMHAAFQQIGISFTLLFIFSSWYHALNFAWFAGASQSFETCQQIIGEWSDSGSLGLSEFLTVFALSNKDTSTDDDLQAAFELLDADRDGRVSVASTLSAFCAMSPGDSRAVITELMIRPFPEEKERRFRAFMQNGTFTQTDFSKMMKQ